MSGGGVGVFEIETFKALQKPHAKSLQRAELAKCAANKMYALFNFPTMKVSGGERQLLDVVLEQVLAFRSRKWSPMLQKYPMVEESDAYLTSSFGKEGTTTPAATTDIKLFVFLFILSVEEELQDFMRDSICLNAPGNYLGERARIHFDQFVQGNEKKRKKKLSHK
jgi:hypothetical protein